MFEQDDVENWVSLTTTAGGSMARRLLLNSRMGLRSDDSPVVEPLTAESFHGPGRAQVGYNEYNQRELLNLWADYLQWPGCPAAADSRHRHGGHGMSPASEKAIAIQRFLGTCRRISSWWTRRTCWTPSNTRRGFETLTDDIRYVMPVRVTTARGAGFDTSPGMAHFDEDKYSLSQRVARMGTEHAWAEDPPSRLRHFITNVRTFECDDDGTSVGRVGRTAVPQPGRRERKRLVSCGREDVLRWCGGPQKTLKLARRNIIADESVLRMQNLAVFL